MSDNKYRFKRIAFVVFNRQNQEDEHLLYKLIYSEK